MAKNFTQFSTPDKGLCYNRLIAQGLVFPEHQSPVDVVRSFALMQGQDLGVVSSVALRTPSKDISLVLDAMRNHQLVRGYPMRGTVFLGAASDIAWITELCSGSIAAQGAARAEKAYGLDAQKIDKLRSEIDSLGAEGLSRADFKELVSRTLPELNDPATGKAPQSVIYRALFQLIVEGTAVYSGWDGKDQLIHCTKDIVGPGLEEKFGGDRVAATAELLTRYVTSRGFVSVDDFAWWSKLPKSLISQALEKVPESIVATHNVHISHPWSAKYEALPPTKASGRGLLPGIPQHYLVDARQLEEKEQRWPFAEDFPPPEATRPMLLPAFDEYILGYKDRLFAMNKKVHDLLVPGNRGIFKKAVIVDSTVRGAWNRKGTVGKRTLETEVFSSIPKVAYPKLETAFREFPFATD